MQAVAALNIDTLVCCTISVLYLHTVTSFMPASPQKLIRPGWLDDRASSSSTTSMLVCAGEEHDHPLHHRMEFNLIKAVHGLTQV
jgi:hypothetical protein